MDGSNCDSNGGGGGGIVFCQFIADECALSRGDGSVLYPFGMWDVDSGVLVLKFIIIDVCSRVDDEFDRVGLPYWVESG